MLELLKDFERRREALGLPEMNTNQVLARAGLMKLGHATGVGCRKIYDGATCLGFFNRVTAWGPALDRLEAQARASRPIPLAA